MAEDIRDVSNFPWCIVLAVNALVLIKLIPRDSIESPLYPGNLTFHERVQVPTNANPVSTKASPFLIACDNPLCHLFNCVNNQCFYNVNCKDGSSTYGVASWESFTFVSQYALVTTIHDVSFGCSFASKGFPGSQFDRVSGILGFGHGQSSLIQQIGSFIESRFSYCFFDPQPEGGYMSVGFLKFGIDMGYRGGQVQTTPSVNHSTSDNYYLNLLASITNV
ncbi:aspartyl protease AED1-like [Pistacia vera]|uniref:aspartyl protease AED1-like n=1 Tax=Pistacia vera TaxID=55513 RepID=UPI001262BB69|nr:aspartyl protease AED1-like [Pistacia vera]